MNKILVTVYIPAINTKYDLKIPLNKKIHNIIILLLKEVKLKKYEPTYMPSLYNKYTGERYDNTSSVYEAKIINATELLLI